LREFLGNYLRKYLFALVRKAASEVCQALLLTQELPQLVAKNSLIESTYLHLSGSWTFVACAVIFPPCRSKQGVHLLTALHHLFFASPLLLSLEG
jgi:hypothetical protein